MANRPIELEEYQKAIKSINKGLIYELEGIEIVLRPNYQVTLSVQLQASLGLRIEDILALRLKNFKNGKLKIKEDKTDKLQYRDIDTSIINAIYQYAMDNNIRSYDKLFKIGARAIQK